MKRISVVFMMFIMAVACTAFAAQQPMGGGAQGMHMHHMQIPPAKGPMLHVANELVEAINKQDAAALQKMLAPDAVYLDEDGHAPPARAWVHKLTAGSSKHITISSTHSQMWGDAGWVSFNYSLTEEYQGKPKTLYGTASIVVRKIAAGKWEIQLVHGALKQTVAGITQ